MIGGGEVMAQNDMITKIGSLAFIIGIIIALLFGLYQGVTYESYLEADIAMSEIFFKTDTGGAIAWILAIIGLIVGILAFFGKGTITAKETPGFLLAGIALVIMGGVFPLITADYPLQPYIGSLLAGVGISVAIFAAPAVGLLAVKAIWDMGKD
jgi:hypothetical protein